MRRAALAVATSLCPILAACSIASAGTYKVSAGDRAPAQQNNSMQPFNTDIAHLVTGSALPPSQASGEQAKATGLYATDALTASGNAAQGASAGWSFNAPPGASIVGVQPDRYLGAYGDNGWVPAITANGATLESCTFAFPQTECAVGEPFGNVNSLGGVVPVNNASTFSVGITCTGSEGCLTGGTLYKGWGALFGVTVTLSENAVPSVSSVTGALWGPGPADGFHKGIESVSFQASDPSGISQALLLVDGIAAATQPGVCDFTYPIPCQNLTRTLTLDTSQLGDGPHTLMLAAFDAALNQTQVSHQIVVDNTAPPPPIGLSAVRALDGSDTLTWSNPPHVAPLTQVSYQLCPIAPSACKPPQGAADQERLGGLHPPKGRWTAKVWLADLTGNVNPAQAASVALPEPLVLRLGHNLKGRRLTVYVRLPSGVSGPVTVGYRALRGSRVLAHGGRRVSVRHHEARIVVLLPKSASKASQLYLTAHAPYAVPARLVVTLSRHKRL